MEQVNQKKFYNIGVISLGCDKNRIDTEKMLFCIKMYGHKIVNDINLADIIIINTCAFLRDSREESINTILDASCKTDGKKPIIVTGCLPQKHIDEIFNDLTEAAGFLGTNDYDKILEAIENVACGKRYNGVKTAENSTKISGRVITTEKHYAFLMISDGCNNNCSYCLIPFIRGRYRSFKIEDILGEAEELIKQGVKELILVAQDVTRYGKDLYGEYSLVRLIKELSKLEGLGENSIRLLYCYPELVSDELINEIKNNGKVIKYIDIPLQHVSDKILKDMRRRSDYNSITALIKKLRTKIPEISVRSTFIVGFPGETEEDFKQLCGFLKENELENAGFFVYSREKGTAAYSYENQVHYRTKQRRLKEINFLQQGIYYKKNKEILNKEIEIICDGYDKEKQLYYGRTAENAPLSDKLVYFKADFIVTGGQKCKIFAESCDAYDIYGKLSE